MVARLSDEDSRVADQASEAVLGEERQDMRFVQNNLTFAVPHEKAFQASVRIA
jgi:hypothetical protein